MTTQTALIAVLALTWLAVDLPAQSPVAAPPLPRYPEIRTKFNQSLSQSLTNEQRLDLYRQTVAQGRYSGRPMMKRMLGDFQPGSFKLSPTSPGLSTNVRLLASDNRNVVMGNARTLRYAMSIQSDGRLNVEGLNRSRVNSIGKTDADIVFRHKSTGLRVRMEVKNVTPASQRANIVKLQRQILKMAQDAHMTGEKQVWANRQKVLPEVRAFAERHGVRVEERLRTGSTNLRPGDRSFDDFANDLDKELRLQAKMTAVAGSVKAGLGLYTAYQAIRQLKSDVVAFNGTRGELLRIGEHGSTLLAGGGFILAGTAQLARLFPELANSAKLVSLTKWGGRLGIAGGILAEGFLVSQYLNGDLTANQFWHSQATLGGGVAGGVAGGFAGYWIGGGIGAGLGALIGLAVPGPGTAAGASVGFTWGSSIGGIVGSVGGGVAGSHFAGRGVDSLYQLQDSAQHEKYAEFLLRHYQSR